MQIAYEIMFFSLVGDKPSCDENVRFALDVLQRECKFVMLVADKLIFEVAKNHIAVQTSLSIKYTNVWKLACRRHAVLGQCNAFRLRRVANEHALVGDKLCKIPNLLHFKVMLN